MGKAKSEATTIRLSPETAWGVAPGAGGWVRTGVNPGGITDWESKNTYVERDPLSTYAAREKGDLVGRTVEPKLTHDLVKDWIDLHAAPVFRCAAKHNGGTGQRLYHITAVVDGGVGADSFSVAANGAITAGRLVRARGLANAQNNATFVVAAGSDADSINVPTGSLVAEAAPPANATVEVCGVQGAAGDIKIDGTGNLTSVALDFTTLGLVVGQGLIIGGSAVGTQFDSIGQQRAWIKSIAANLIELEDRSWTVGALDNGGGKTIRLGFGSWYRNVPIDHADYLEPSLYGEKEELGPGTANAAIYTYASGLGVKTFEIDAPLESKIVTTVGYVGKDIPDPVLVANRAVGAANAFTPLAVALIDTASDTKKVRLMDSNGELVTEVNSYKLTFENNIKARKVQGSIGAADLLYGKFEPTLTMEVYFTDWQQAKAMNDDRDLRWDAYHANLQVGLWWRMPYCAARGGSRSYPANDAVMISMEVPGFRDPLTNVVASLMIFPDPVL
jgi:hypothetical protein